MAYVAPTPITPSNTGGNDSCRRTIHFSPPAVRRPDRIGSINRSLKLSRLQLALSLRKCKGNYKNIPTDYTELTRSLHITARFEDMLRDPGV